MKELTIDYGLQLVNSFKKEANKCIIKKKYNDALIYIKAAAWVKYDFFIGYKDEELELFLRSIAQEIPCTKYEKRNNSIAFIDAFSKDTQGLSAQYIDAIISTGYRLLYLYENEFSQNSSLFFTLSSYKNVELRRVPEDLKEIDKSIWIYNAIVDFGADKVLSHLLPNSALECVALYALPKEICRFQINLTDHAFWLGTGCSDYTIEFRQIGCSLSSKEREFRKEQILLLPFYPVKNNIPFEGFPISKEDGVIIFSGGAYYKVIDKNDTFFKLAKLILDRNPNAFILFATQDSQFMVKNKVNQYELGNRFILMPFRKDIAAIFENIDIYLNTYPFGGGLMCQYAANYGIPILNYKDESIEECVGQKDKVSFTSKTENSFIKEACRLCSDTSYRKEKGELIRKAVITVNEFNSYFEKMLNEKKSPIPVNIEGIFYKRDQEAKMKSINMTDDFRIRMVRILGLYKSAKFLTSSLIYETPHFLHNKLRSFFKI